MTDSACSKVLASEDADPRGMAVVGVDNVVAGTVSELWIDRGEMMLRYLEVAVKATGKQVLLPMMMARVDAKRARVTVASIRGDQFAQVPLTASLDQVTLREEDRISAYYAGGHLYALPSRSEPLI
jgi:photosynthetic reaction center H subunit